MDTLLSTDPHELYTENCAVLAVNLPGTLGGHRCASTVWYETKTMLTLAASYPCLIASRNDCGNGALDMLTTAGVWGDFGEACKATMSFLDIGRFLDITEVCRTPVWQYFPDQDEIQMIRWLKRETREMKEIYMLCQKFYFGRYASDDKMNAAREILDTNFVHLYTKARLLTVLAQALMVCTYNPVLFDRFRCIFLRTVTLWPNYTPRLQSCAEVTLGLDRNSRPDLTVKLMASLLREVTTANGFPPVDFYRDDKNLLVLCPYLSSENIYFAPDITLVYNLKRNCLGVEPEQYTSVPLRIKYGHFNMVAYTVMKAARSNSKPNASPGGYASGSIRPSTPQPKYVKLNGVPSEEDYESNYLKVCSLKDASASLYGFLVWSDPGGRYYGKI